MSQASFNVVVFFLSTPFIRTTQYDVSWYMLAAMKQDAPIHLSKSRFIAGMQCPKRLYLSVYPPEVSGEDNCTESLSMLNGNAVGEVARSLYPGTMVEYGSGLLAAINMTAELMADENIQCIHEATFSFEHVLVRVDLLQRTATGWILTEVKAATSVKDYYLNDAAVQAWVLKGCGVQIDAVHLMHVNNQFIYQGDGSYEGLLQAEDITQHIDARMKGMKAQKDTLMDMLAGDEPEIAMGKQCTSPFACGFCSYCEPDDLPEYPVTILPNLCEPKKSALLSKYSDVTEIPESELSNEKHRRVWQASCDGEEQVDVVEAAAVLNALTWPRYYIDFETIALAVPCWKGVRPYVQIPFQWSCHIHHKDGRMEHVEFLDVTGNDPRRACAEGLVKHIGSTGILIAYNARFEKGVILGLAKIYPDLSESLLEMNERFFDLLPLTRNAYYHPSQMGSWSIKAVLPALVPELNYNDLDGVQNGSDAQLSWIKATHADETKQQRIANQLLAYCKLDTWAMVKIVDALLERVERGLKN